MFSVLRKRNFALLWCGQLVSLAGDYVLLVALPFYVYQLTGSLLQTGGMFIAEMLPRLLLGSVAGVFVDRWNRRWTMLAADVSRAAVLTLLLLVRSGDQLWLIYIVALLQSMISQFFVPASNALIPALVADKELVAANSLNGLNDALTRLIGPSLGGVLFALTGIVGIVAVDSGTYLFSALMILFIVLPATRKEAKTGTASISTSLAQVWHEWLDGLQVIRKQQVINGLFVAVGVFMLGQGMLNVLIIAFVKVIMHETILVYGWLITAQGVGAILGALLLAPVSKLVRPVYLISAALAMAGVVVLIVANIPVLLLALPLIALVGVFFVGFIISSQTLLQRSTADSYRGRVFGTYTMVMAVTALLGMILASTTGDYLSITLLMNIAGGFFVLSGVTALILMRGTNIAQDEPQAQDAGKPPQGLNPNAAL